MLGGVFPALPGLSGRMDFPLTHTVLFGFFSFILLCSEVWKEGYSTGVEQTLLQVRAGMTGLPCKVAACNPLRWIIGWLLLRWPHLIPLLSGLYLSGRSTLVQPCTAMLPAQTFGKGSQGSYE